MRGKATVISRGIEDESERVASSRSRGGPHGFRLWNSVVPPALTMLILVASALGLLSSRISSYDDSWLLMGARLVAAGKLPYIDFHTNHGPLGYTFCAWLNRLFANAGITLRMGQILLLTGIAVLLHVLFRRLQTETPLREYPVPILVLAFSQAAMLTAFFGFGLTVISLVLFLLAQNAIRKLDTVLLLIAAGVVLAAAALARPVFAGYCSVAILLLESAAGRRRLPGSLDSIAALAAFFGTACISTLLILALLYPNMSPATAFNAAVVEPSRLIVFSGSRYLIPYFLLAAGIGIRGLAQAVAVGAAIFATAIIGTIAVSGGKTRRLSMLCIAAGGVFPFAVMNSERPGRDAGFLALALFLLTAFVIFAGRSALRDSALLHASAAFGITSAAFGHYFWARGDSHHLVPQLTLALLGAMLPLAQLPVLGRLGVVGLFCFVYVFAVRPFFLPVAVLVKHAVASTLLPWRCTTFRADAIAAVTFADRQSDPGSRFVAVGSSQAWSSANPIDLFLISSRLPYTRWFAYDPGLQTSPAVQKVMERDLEASGSRTAVVWRAERYLFEQQRSDLAARSAFDGFFDSLYPITAARFGDYEIRFRAPGTPAER